MAVMLGNNFELTMIGCSRSWAMHYAWTEACLLVVLLESLRNASRITWDIRITILVFLYIRFQLRY